MKVLLQKTIQISGMYYIKSYYFPYLLIIDELNYYLVKKFECC